MKKFFIICAALLICSDANSAWGPKFGSNDTCIVERKNGRKFYFCGKSQDKCDGKKVTKWSTERTYKHKGSFSSKYDSGRKFWCCNPDEEDYGRWIESSSWYDGEQYTEIKELETGTCNVVKRKNVCGDAEIIIDCDVPDDCPGDTLLRNGECVKPCDDGSVFESDTSNKCMKCETTKHQGIDENLKCVKCDKSSEFWDEENKKCVKKNELTKISHDVMQQCYKCTNNTTFKECVFYINSPNRVTPEKRAQIITDCDLD